MKVRYWEETVVSMSSIQMQKFDTLMRMRLLLHLFKTINKRSKNTICVSVNCKDVSVIVSFFIREKLGEETRRGLFTFKNMPFLRVKDALLDARRASSAILFVIYWYSEGYKLDSWGYYIPAMRELFSIICNDFLCIYKCPWDREKKVWNIH